MNAAPQPFPFTSLPAYSRQEVELTRNVRAAGRSIGGALAAALTELCQQPISIALRRARPFELATIRSDALGVTLTLAEGGLPVLIDVETPLATTLVAHALRQRAPRVIDASRTGSPEIAGAFGAVFHAALRRTGLPPLRVIAAGPAQALARDLSATTNARLTTAWIAVTIGPETFAARVTVPVALLGDATAGISSTGIVDALGEVPFALPLVLGTVLATRTDLLSLRAGDAFLLPASKVQAAASGLVGPVALVGSRSEKGLAGVLEEKGVLRTGALGTHSWDRPATPPKEDSMSEERSAATLEVLDDAPVVVRVEVGAVEMKAREWAALHPGDVITVGRKLGDPAILRIGGVEVARGELVQVEGEIGVRIIATTNRTGGGNS